MTTRTHRTQMHDPSRRALTAPLLVAFAAFVLASAFSTAAAAQEPEAQVAPETNVSEDSQQTETPKTIVVPPEWMKWLAEVEPLISQEERLFFLTLDQNYEREAFERGFWRVRDPYPRTARNELEERWPVRLAEARNRWGSLDDDRSRIYVVHGPPAGQFEVKCTETRKPAEVWFYRGTDWTRVQTALIFVKLRPEEKARLWRPFDTTVGIESSMSRIRNCINGSQMMQIASVLTSNGADYEKQLRELLVKPRPSSTEWIHTFAAYSTDLEPGETPLPAELGVGFPGRHQNRTVVQGLLEVAKSDAGVGEFAGYRSHDFRLTGDVLLADGGHFESFRYQFGFATETAPETLPLAFQRYLRPGTYTLILKLDDLNSDRAWRQEIEVEVPTSDVLVERAVFRDPETEKLFAEVAEAVAAGEDGIRLVPPQDELLSGFVRFDTLIAGDRIEKVRFFLDDKPVLTKNRPPFNVQLDLGPYPDLHTLRVEGLDADGVQVADDDLLINSGGYRFIVRLREPRPGLEYSQSLRARAEVEVPDGRTLDRVEFFLDETKVATLYQEPFVQPIVLPRPGAPGYVRAVAYLGDGNTTEDLVFINSPDYIDELEIQFVELYTTVLDAAGRPVTDLERSDFRVEEDGVPQTISRFERVENLPIHVGILLDSSASMHETLDDVKRAALSFLQQAIGSKDRAAVIPFNTFPRLAVELTNDRQALGSGLAGLAPEGKTALYDSVMFALYYFAGVKGQRAILVLSDGRDESSRFSFDDTLEYARRAGITIYTIGLRLAGDPGARQKLTRLAEETGGSSYFLRAGDDLGPVYTAIQNELRSQLLIAYQSTNTDEDSGFRQVELEVDRPDVTVKTLSGYYP